MNAYLKKKPTLRERKKNVQRWFVSTSFRVSLLAFIFVLSALYVFKVNTVSTQGFVISDLEEEIQLLERENKQLDVKIASHRSMKSIEERLQDMELVQADNIVYVTPVGSAVARR